jgi:hypothetical protein
MILFSFFGSLMLAGIVAYPVRTLGLVAITASCPPI